MLGPKKAQASLTCVTKDVSHKPQREHKSFAGYRWGQWIGSMGLAEFFFGGAVECRADALVVIFEPNKLGPKDKPLANNTIDVSIDISNSKKAGRKPNAIKWFFFS